MNGKAMMLLLPLGESLGKWIKKWDYELGRSVETLYPEGWFVRVHYHDGGEYNTDGIWIPKFRTGNFIRSPPWGCHNCYTGTTPSSSQAYQLCTCSLSDQASLEQLAETHAQFGISYVGYTDRKRIHLDSGNAWDTNTFQFSLISTGFYGNSREKK